MLRWAAICALALLHLLLFHGTARAQPSAREHPEEARVQGDWHEGGASSWSPAESILRGAQYDERLDRPVRLWATGLTVAAGLAEITSRTGVTLCQSETYGGPVRLNLYLNPHRPPTLRELMVNLAWTTNCVWAIRETGQPQAPFQYLLGRGALPRLAEASSAERQTEQGAEASRTEWSRKSIARKLQECRQALALAEPDIISRYWRRDDYTLFALLDPRHRAALELICNLRAPDRDAVLNGKDIRREWFEWDDRQRAQLRKALGIDQHWLDIGLVHVVIGGADTGSLVVYALALPASSRGNPAEWLEVGAVYGIIWAGQASLTPTQQYELYRFVGKTPGEPQEQEYEDPANGGFDLRQGRAEHGYKSGASFGPTVRLSSRAEALFSSTEIRFDATAGDLWSEIEERIAQASGANVIADCYTDAPVSIPRWRLPRQTKVNVVSILHLIHSLCWPSPDGTSDIEARECDTSGTFVRFRSISRELLSESVLSTEVLANVNHLVTLYQKRQSGELAYPSRSDQLADIRVLSSVAAQLDDQRLRHGGVLVYGNPRDSDERARQAMREHLLQIVRANPLLRLLGTLTSEQWSYIRLHQASTTIDLTAEQTEVYYRIAQDMPGSQAVCGSEDVQLRFSYGEQEREPAGSGADRWHLEAFAGDVLVADQPLPVVGRIGETGSPAGTPLGWTGTPRDAATPAWGAVTEGPIASRSQEDAPATGERAASAPPVEHAQDSLRPERIMLVYNSGTAANLTVDGLLPYVAHRTFAHAIDDWFFDSFLLIALTAPSGRGFCPGYGEGRSQLTDWIDHLDDRLFGGTSDLANLNRAVDLASKVLHDEKHQVRVIIGIPYPDPESRRFGTLAGRELDLSRDGDRERAVAWYIAEISRRWRLAGFPHLRLNGVYWTHEEVREQDRMLVSRAASSAHAYGLRLYWIPWFGAQGAAQWRQLGFDVAVQQPNHYFQDSGPERLREAAAFALSHDMGIEFELDRRVLESEPHRERYMRYLDAGFEHGLRDDSVVAWYDDGALLACAESGGGARRIYDSTYGFVRESRSAKVATLEQSEAVISP